MLDLVDFYIGLDKQIFERKIVNIFLPISFNICFGFTKEAQNISILVFIIWYETLRCVPSTVAG